MTRRLVRRTASSVLLVAAVATNSLAQVAPTMPDLRFDSRSSSCSQFYVNGDGTLAMRVSHDLPERKVRIRHHYFYDVPARRALTRDTLEATSYWPTCTAPFANGKFLVAGKSPRTGNTVLELWSVSPPTAPSASAIGPTAEFQPGGVSERVGLYDATAAGRDIVMRMQPMLTPSAVPTHVLVQFFDSRDIFSFDVVQQTLVCVASPIAHANCLTVPLLSQPLMSQSRRHVSEGYLYIYSHDDAPASETSIAILRDTNMDAVIDGVSTYSLAQYQAAGYSSQSAWID